MKWPCSGRKYAKSSWKKQASVAWLKRKEKVSPSHYEPWEGFHLYPETSGSHWKVLSSNKMRWDIFKDSQSNWQLYGEKTGRSKHGLRRPVTASQMRDNDETHYWQFCDLKKKESPDLLSLLPHKQAAACMASAQNKVRSCLSAQERAADKQRTVNVRIGQFAKTLNPQAQN